MNRTVRKIGLILFLIILLPVIIFITYQLSTLNEDEAVIRKIYGDQLESILFSVNQSSEDIVSNWAGDIEEIIQRNDIPESKAMLDSFASSNTAINYIFSVKETEKPEINFYGIKGSDSVRINAVKIIDANKENINKLRTYKRGGYRKIEPVDEADTPGSKTLVFLAQLSKENYLIVGMVIRPIVFVDEYLRPKLQSSAQEKFIINVVNDITGQAVYSTEEMGGLQVQQKKSLWLIPNFSLGILLKGRTIDSLVNERQGENILMLSLVGIVLIIGVIVVFRTIKKEVELAQIKSDFVSNVSHELRTPLALITMFAETLELGRAKSEEKKKEYYTIISQEANRLSRIVNSILNFSRMEAGKRVFNFNPVNLNDVVDKVTGTYDFHLHSKGFEYSVNKDNTLPTVKLDGEAVAEAFINVLDNAVKYSGDKKMIEIKTGTSDQNVYFEVRDFGIGISEENQKKIFDKFFRVQSGLVHETKGTGLGLSLVKHIVDAHKGKIELQSKLGEGTSVRLLFPITKS